MNKAKSVLLPYMEVKVCSHRGYGCVICALYLIMCLCGQYVLQNPVYMHLYLNCIGSKNSTQSTSVGVVVGVVKKVCCHQKHCAWDVL